MLISVVNVTSGTIADADIQTVLRAVNRQIAEDFLPYWGFGAQLRLEGASSPKPNPQNINDMRGDAILYLWNGHDVEDALGYHDQNFRGIPYGFVFTELAARLGEHWSITLSHEALELVGDPMCNLLVQGPHPDDVGKIAPRIVFHWFEMCDAVQNESYVIDSVKVSNFVLPLYFTGAEESGGRNDFLNNSYKRLTLRSFRTNPGGYVGFFDPKSDKPMTFADPVDARAKQRMTIKLGLPAGRSFSRKVAQPLPPLVARLPLRQVRVRRRA